MAQIVLGPLQSQRLDLATSQLTSSTSGRQFPTMSGIWTRLLALSQASFYPQVQ